jgi:hypothetical protein
MLDLSHMIQDMTKDIKLNECEFKIIKDKKDEPKYKEVSKFVGGMVECITFPNGDLLLINEEGKLIGVTGRKDFVVGPAILIKKQALKQWAS